MIHERFKEIVHKKRLTYKEIGILLGYSESKMKALANGKQTITPEIALHIEEKLGINPVWLIFGRGEMVEPKMDLGVDKVASPKGECGDRDAMEILKDREKFKQELLDEIKVMIKEMKNTTD
jgi:transcriptional regulator with XRE-family HTH domain